MFHKEFLRWVIYEPKKSIYLEDLPIGDKWWVILYWLPKIKKDLYLLLLSRGMRAVEHKLYDELGIDQGYFEKDFGFFIRRLNNMKRLHKASKHLGETGV
jgi:hypothetical protein